MNARPDFALCPVRAKSCTHHAHCARAQLKPHATRQAWFTPNRRGDECFHFAPIEAFTLPAEPLSQGTLNSGGPSTLAESENLGQSPTVNAPQGVPSNGDGAAECREGSGESDSANTLTLAGSDAANTEPRTNAEAGGVQFGAGRSSSPANETSTGHAAGSTLAPAPSIPATRSAVEWVTREAGGVMPSSAAGIPNCNNRDDRRRAPDSAQPNGA